MKLFFVALILVFFIQIQSETVDYVSTFLRTRNPNDLPASAKDFLLLVLTQSRSDLNSHWCCAVTPPSIPIFSSTGTLLSYQLQPCPDTHMVCCKGFINISGQCFSFDEIKNILPAWQSLISSFGSSLTPEQVLSLVHQIG